MSASQTSVNTLHPIWLAVGIIIALLSGYFAVLRPSINDAVSAQLRSSIVDLRASDIETKQEIKEGQKFDNDQRILLEKRLTDKLNRIDDKCDRILLMLDGKVK
jgi:hypothetical protein